MSSMSPSRLAYGKERALNEMRSIFSCQWSNGMLPQIRFVPEPQGAGPARYRPDAEDWGVTPQISGPTHLRTSGITQPPIMGLCVYDIFLKFSEAAREEHLADFVAFSGGLQRFHDWLLTERDPWGEGLALCLHPWETGTDNSPAFDPLIEVTRHYIEQSGLPVHLFGRADTANVAEAHRPTDRDYFAYFGLLVLFKEHSYRQRAIIDATPYLLQDVLFNSLLAASLLAHSRLQLALSEVATAGAGPHIDKAKLSAGADEALASYRHVAEAVRRKMWHPEDGFFYSFDAGGNRLLRIPTISGFGPLLAGVASEEEAAGLIARLADPDHFRTRVPVPSTSVASPYFDPLRYWSGPSWPVTNWLVIRGLLEREGGAERDLAGTLLRSTLEMIAEGHNIEDVGRAAAALMEGNSVGEEFTTPSRRQYQHGWLWDSAIVAASWPLVDEKPVTPDTERGGPGFWEYYHPQTGEPLGAAGMTWTASLCLELLHMAGRSTRSPNEP